MNETPEDAARPLQRVLALTPVGRQELREPQSGLSLPQRWLLGQLDGQADLAAMAARPGSRSPERLPRDAAKLVQLGLAVDVGATGPEVESFGPASVQGDLPLDLPLDDGAPAATTAAPADALPAAPTRSALPARPMAPRLAAGAVMLVLGSAAAYFVVGGSAGTDPVGAKPASGAAPTARADTATALGAASAPAAASGTPAASPVVELTAAAPAPVMAINAAARPPVQPAPAPASKEAVTTGTVRPAPTAGAASVAQPAAPAAATALPTPSPAPAPVAPTVAPAPGPAAVPAGAGPSASAPVLATAPLPPPAASAPAAVTAVALRPLSTVEPTFPRDGLGLGSNTVTLQARLTVDATGAVTAVNFVPSSAATRAFERAARTALLQWRFPAGQGDRQYTQQLRFSEE